MANSNYNPDVLNCIANLSNDEVFTPPELANKVLDLLPQDLFRDPNTTFLDPVSKSGVFLREIVKRLDRGLESQIPDRQERIDHILHTQVYGLAITELTSYLSRRSLYCSKHANGKYSVSQFNNESGNVLYANRNHTWENGKCKYCGASQAAYDRGPEAEQYAYMFIHTDNPKQFFGIMKFDVIIGNPPYQMSFGLEGGNSANAKSIYNLFISQAIKLSPRYLTMITPSRWMTKTAQGIPEEWVDSMLNDHHFRVMHDYEDASECFPGVEIKGGVNYFLWDKDYDGVCNYYFHAKQAEEPIIRKDFLDGKKAGVVIRSPRAYSIIERIEKEEGRYYSDTSKNFSGLVSPKHFFDDSELLTSNWHDYKDKQSSEYSIKYYLNLNRERTFRWISPSQLPKNKATKDLHKVFIPAAGGSGNDDIILGKPFYGEPNSVCSQTFLVIGYDPSMPALSKKNCDSIISYIRTKFFRYLVSIKKKTQNGPRGVYQFVPMQNFSHPWTDEMLYEKYKLTSEEIAFIESMIRPME